MVAELMARSEAQHQSEDSDRVRGNNSDNESYSLGRNDDCE